MNDNDFIFAVARIRAKEKSLLTDADVAQMTAMKDEQSVLAFLKDKGWGDSSRTENAEELLAAEEQKTRELAHELGIEESVFEILSYPVVYHNLKAGIKELCTEEQNPQAFFPDRKLGREQILRILKDKDYTALPVHMRDAAKRAYETLLLTRDGQQSDVIVDRACLDAMEDVAKHSKYGVLRDYEESMVAVTDIRIAARAAKTGKSAAFLKEAIAPCKTLDTEGLKAAAAAGTDELLNFLTARGYGEAAEALKVSLSSFERWCDNRLIDSLRAQKRNPFSVGPVVAFYLARQNEIKTARIILTAKANGFSDEEIRERVRSMYV